ncbi:MAG: FAD synthetase family protein [Spirochaetaceae bacterium]|jgi:riboflavin kinase/FMN adenylyltransferase|nr:FAD synthetase family protein [Spirochaetaceae bacterium]
MYILDWEEFIKKPISKASAVTIGVFDGVHRGHQLLIGKIKSKGLFSLVVSFKQHPRRLLRPEQEFRDIISLEEKIAILEEYRIDAALLIDFSLDFGKIKGKDFIKILTKNAGMRYLAIGKDFKCGYKGVFGASQIQAWCHEIGIECEIVEPVADSGVPVSSSRIRGALASGDRETAERLLGRPLR